MSLRREQNAELDRVYHDFINYFQKKGMHMPMHPPYMKPYPCYDSDHDNDCDNYEYYHKKHHHTKPMPKPHHPHHPHYQKPTTLPFELPFYPYSYLGLKRLVEDTDEYTTKQTGRASKVLEPASTCDTNVTFPTVYTPDLITMEPRVDGGMSVEQKYYKALFSDLNKNFAPYVAQVIKSNNYVGSPINDKYFDREALAQMVSEVLQRAKSNPKLVGFITSLDPKIREIIKNLVEALVLGELFVIHRPNTKLNEGNMMNTMPYNSQNARYNNMYGDPKNSKPLGESMDKYLMPCTHNMGVMQPMDMMNHHMGMMGSMETNEPVIKNMPPSNMSSEMQNFSN